MFFREHSGVRSEKLMKRIIKMFEVSSHADVQQGIKAAHASRALAVEAAWNWLFGKKSSR
jgi:hypothetical protein